MRWTHTKRRRPEVPVACNRTVDEEPPVSIARVVGAQPLRSETIDVNELLEALPRQLAHGQLARLLWMEDYWQVFVLTLGQFADVSEPLAEIFMGVRDRRRADVDRATVMRLVSSVVSVVQGEESKRTLPFPLVAKSISFLMQRVPTRVWTVERKQSQLLSTRPLRSVLA